MQTLLFNTTEKTIRLYEGPKPEGTIICKFNSIPTVKIYDGYYEVKQKDEDEIYMCIICIKEEEFP